MIKLTQLAIAATIVLGANASWAEGPTCSANATEKKLAGAAIMNKGDPDAAATCDATAAEKKIAGVVESRLIKKSVNDAVG